MKTAIISFEGKIINTIEFVDRISNKQSDGQTLLFGQNGILAVIPANYMVEIKYPND